MGFLVASFENGEFSSHRSHLHTDEKEGRPARVLAEHLYGFVGNRAKPT